MPAIKDSNLNTETITASLPAQQFATPDSYHFFGDGISVSFLPVGAGGVAHFTYHDSQRTLQFTGDQIRKVQVSDLGTVISVTLVMTVDSGSTTFSLLLPAINLPNQRGASVGISTEGITTVHRLSIVPGLNYGQRELYKVTQLRGTASLVIIPL